MRKLVFLLAIGVGLLPGVSTQLQVAQAQGACEFTLGFRTLHDMIPNIVGNCIENEWHNELNGDGLQRTTQGLMVWRKIDNWTAFTDGSTTWINGPMGLQSRLNTQTFPWEPVSAPVPAPAPPGPAPAPAPPAPAPTATPAPSADARPVARLEISDEDPRQNEEFTITVEATDDKGLSGIRWWATDTDDDELRQGETHECGGFTSCRRTWTEKTNDDGRIYIHAEALDTAGQTSEALRTEIRVREAAPPKPKV